MIYKYKSFTSEDCPLELYQFRYNVYVEEMKRPQQDADHDKKIIKDKLDKKGHHAAVYFNDEIVACMRVNFLREGSVGKYHELYGLKALSLEAISSASICTRLMVDRKHRHRFVTIHLLQYIYAYGLKNGIESCFMDCNKPLQRFFEKFGYRFVNDTMHPDYGRVSVMKLDLLDIDYLKSINSPFVMPYEIARDKFPALEMADLTVEFVHPADAR